MAAKGKRPMRSLTPSDKIDAIQRVNDGESKASVARDIGVPESTLRGWCKNEDKLRYMTSRISSPDTDKSNDGEPPDKRGRTVSPAAPQSPDTAAGLDLTTPAPAAAAATTSQPVNTAHSAYPQQTADAPVELTTKRSEPAPAPLQSQTPRPPRERRPEPGASVSMSATSPLSGLAHIPGITSHLGLSYNDIANNLHLFTQLGPSFSAAYSAQPASRALRSVRSPKPAHNGVLNHNDHKHRRKSHHSTDPYRSSLSVANQSMDETLWFWLKSNQNIIDQTAAIHPLQFGKTGVPNGLPKTVSAAAPILASPWFSQYYKYVGGAMTTPDGRHKSGTQVPKEKIAAENILYSQLTKGKVEEERGTSPVRTRAPQSERNIRNEAEESTHAAEPAISPGVDAENKEPVSEPSSEVIKNQIKVRNVLDNLLFNNTERSASAKTCGVVNGEWASDAAEALEHGDKFLAWLEASSDPSVTRMHVHQLRALLLNLRARRAPAAPQVHDHASRRK